MTNVQMMPLPQNVWVFLIEAVAVVAVGGVGNAVARVGGVFHIFHSE
jgi:hypothetical protein